MWRPRFQAARFSAAFRSPGEALTTPAVPLSVIASRPPHPTPVQAALAQPPAAAETATTPAARPSKSRIPFADDLIAQYRGPSMQEEAKRGCYTVFFAAFAVLGAILLTVWFFKYRHTDNAAEPAKSTAPANPR